MNNTRARYVLVNTKHYLRLLMLDRHKYASIDHQSILTEISSSNTSVAKVAPVAVDE